MQQEGLLSMKIPNDTIRNRTSKLPACSAVPEPIAPPPTLRERRSNGKRTEFVSRKERKRKQFSHGKQEAKEHAVVVITAVDGRFVYSFIHSFSEVVD